MTSDSTAPRNSLNPNEWLASLRAGFAMILKVIMGGMVVVAAGILAVAIAMTGMILAAVAVIYRMVAGKPAAAKVQPVSTGEGVILEARRTAHGWTVE